MKRMLVTISVISVSAMTLFGQGRVLFNNLESGNAMTIGPHSSPYYNGGPQGAFVGDDYSIQLLWAPGTGYLSQGAFDAAVIGSSSVVAFFGSTGFFPAHGPAVDGAGLFDGGTVAIGAPGAYTMQVRGWYSGVLFPTYNAAQNAVANTGRSERFTVNVTSFPTLPSNTVFPSFQVGVLIPEPLPFSLAGLGAACLLCFRRLR